MKVMLTSSLGGSSKVDGVRVPSVLIQSNGQLDRLRSLWTPNANVLIICADPDDHEKNDSVCSCLRLSLPMSGLSISHIEKCDSRNMDAVETLDRVDVLILAGGHVPTQNRFMKQLCLRERLKDYSGTVVAWSAGSMNCAATVYAGPELEGEAVDPLFERWISGLELTDINIFPHYQSLKNDLLDGLRLIEDITFADSMGHDILALNDGSYIMLLDGVSVLYGDAYLIRDGEVRQICKDGGSVCLPLCDR